MHSINSLNNKVGVYMKKKFKFSALLLCICMLLSTISVTSFAEGDVLKGDVDGNGVVDTADARIILQMAASITEADLTTADMNDDGVISLQDAIDALYKASNIGGVVIPDKNGDNYLSDDPNNEFIRLIASTYNVDKNALVAIYSVPDSGTNYVLQFKKSSIFGGSYEKSPNNLYRVYHIGLAPERTISYTEGKLLTGNHNCSGAEGMIVFNLVKTEVMPQYPGYFTGV